MSLLDPSEEPAREPAPEPQVPAESPAIRPIVSAAPSEGLQGSFPSTKEFEFARLNLLEREAFELRQYAEALELALGQAALLERHDPAAGALAKIYLRAARYQGHLRDVNGEQIRYCSKALSLIKDEQTQDRLEIAQKITLILLQSAVLDVADPDDPIRLQSEQLLTQARELFRPGSLERANFALGILCREHKTLPENAAPAQLTKLFLDTLEQTLPYDELQSEIGPLFELYVDALERRDEKSHWRQSARAFSLTVADAALNLPFVDPDLLNAFGQRAVCHLEESGALEAGRKLAYRFLADIRINTNPHLFTVFGLAASSLSLEAGYLIDAATIQKLVGFRTSADASMKDFRYCLLGHRAQVLAHQGERDRLERVLHYGSTHGMDQAERMIAAIEKEGVLYPAQHLRLANAALFFCRAAFEADKWAELQVLSTIALKVLTPLRQFSGESFTPIAESIEVAARAYQGLASVKLETPEGHSDIQDASNSVFTTAHLKRQAALNIIPVMLADSFLTLGARAEGSTGESRAHARRVLEFCLSAISETDYESGMLGKLIYKKLATLSPNASAEPGGPGYRDRYAQLKAIHQAQDAVLLF